MTETTNGIKNNELLKLIGNKNLVMTWMRSMLANYNAHGGEEWAQWFSRLNSGTYNNQWMVVVSWRGWGDSVGLCGVRALVRACT